MRAALPLEGRRIAVFREERASVRFAAALRQLGAVPLEYPAFQIVPADARMLDEALRRIGDFDWIALTSVHGAQAVLARAEAVGLAALPAHVRIAAVGPATARAAAALRVPDAVPSDHRAEALPECMAHGPGARVLLPCGDRAGPALERALSAHGATVERVTAYHTRPAPMLSAAASELVRHPPAALLLTSGSTASFLADALGDRRRQRLFGRIRPDVLCIGPATAAAAAAADIPVDEIAEPHTTDGLMAALVRRFETRARRRS